MRSNHNQHTLNENSSSINQIGPMSQMGQVVSAGMQNMNLGTDVRKNNHY